MRYKILIFSFLCFFVFGKKQVFSQNLPAQLVQKEHAAQLGKTIVQDHNGRLKPMSTSAEELLRKVARRSSLYNLSAEQIVLGMMAKPKDWYQVPLIKTGKHETIKKIIPIEGDLAAFSDFFDAKGGYKLQELVRAAAAKEPRDRGVLDKELQKIDERVNICSMIFSGAFFRVFPIPNDPNNTWEAPTSSHGHAVTLQSPFSEKFYPAYLISLQKSLQSGDWTLCNDLLKELTQYQKSTGMSVYPSDTAIATELALNKFNIFERLKGVYGILSLVFLVLLFTSVFSPNLNLTKPLNVAYWIFVAAVVAHAAGLGMRWYVSGRAPWSNGYESMIYIGFTTVLAGLLFSRKSLGALTATNVLAATIMMVAGLSFLDPEITPLVPVLKSYWLTIHVSLEAGSYGFLMLGAIIGLLSLLLLAVSTRKSLPKTERVVSELTLISEMTLLAGLAMVSVGTYLGGVWANESWGRYWGWDAKETWALVTILVYSFILHMRFIPGLRGHYAFNVASLFGFASVIMTYFGVNYYLSGLHSYAAGDPLPIPNFVYYTAAGFVAISILAKWNHNRLKKSPKAAHEKQNLDIAPSA